MGGMAAIAKRQAECETAQTRHFLDRTYYAPVLYGPQR
ncbi:MAG: hypothetical protein QOF78_218, partial [Phycisphaerales bacterium]|jgi:hypothetical protein|nr:hypothetical protein [Phycisphaerales bacterium]